VFCPLCKAEFRDGFTQCSDCRIPLVATKEADQQSVTRVWKGGDQLEFESVLTALQNAGIPAQFREHLNVGPAVRAGLLSALFARPNRTRDTEFEVEVLEGDFVRAEQAVRQALAETEDT
jgi:hypothetical protein